MGVDRFLLRSAFWETFKHLIGVVFHYDTSADNELVWGCVLPDPKGQSGTRYQPQATMSVLYTPKIWCTPRKMESNTQTNLPAYTLFNHLER